MRWTASLLTSGLVVAAACRAPQADPLPTAGVFAQVRLLFES